MMDLKDYPNLKSRLETVAFEKNGDTGRTVLFYAVMGVICLIVTRISVLKADRGQVLMLVCSAVFFTTAVSVYGEIKASERHVRDTWDAFSKDELQQMEQEAPQAAVYGDTLVTQNALVTRTTYGPMAVKIADIVWIYGKEMSRRRGSLPVGRNYALEVVDRHGKRYNTVNYAENKQNQDNIREGTKQIIQFVQQARPHVLVGYKEEWEKLSENDLPKLTAMADGLPEPADQQ